METASGITYKIGDTNINGDSATVKVDFKYGDASDIMTSALGGLMKKALELVKQGSDWKVTGPNQELLPIFTSHALDALRNLLN